MVSFKLRPELQEDSHAKRWGRSCGKNVTHFQKIKNSTLQRNYFSTKLFVKHQIMQSEEKCRSLTAKEKIIINLVFLLCMFRGVPKINEPDKIQGQLKIKHQPGKRNTCLCSIRNIHESPFNSSICFRVMTNYTQIKDFLQL